MKLYPKHPSDFCNDIIKFKNLSSIKSLILKIPHNVTEIFKKILNFVILIKIKT
jgi:hypothetical protein